MSDFNEGRVAATFQLGARYEDTLEAYQKEVVGLDGMKASFQMVVKTVYEYRERLKQELDDGKVTIKEAEVGMKYITGCIELVQKMHSEADAKRIAAFGAIEALKRVVADTKRVWDEETIKLKQIQDFEATKPKDMKARPVGYLPKDHPVAEYNAETERGDQLAKELLQPPKKSRKAPKTQG